ncbi:MAG: 2-C-methyl-D-erythritol 4-phosphate cytidylyltransferase [Lachnospiraceae bacterium]|nr:2-C-methyl-D-erythritol 4-phosphate cytidylyltransferase [Lachnospiraceae bacterium]
MNYTLVLLSGGVGSRMQQSIPKQYMLLAGKPMIMHILDKVDKIEEIEKIIVVCAEEYRVSLNMMREQYGIKTPITYANAGESRQASVLSGLKMVETDNVIIHEAARPFVTVDDYKELIDCPLENAMIGLDIPFTVLKGHDKVEGLLTRSELVNVQLPQKFNTKILLDAHKKAENEGMKFTEDASLLFYYNPEIPIKIIKGKDYNIKVTTRMDMLTGEIIYDEIFRRRK